MTDLNICPHFLNCPGCTEWLIPINKQIDQKKQIAYDHLKPYLARKSSSESPLLSTTLDSAEAIESFSVGSGHHRVWFDLQFSVNGLGLINKDRQIVPLQTCFLMSGSLKELFSNLLKLKFPNKKISARLRVSPQQKFGLWLDMANVDVKELLLEKLFLSSLADLVDVVEIGQKRKKLDREVKPEDQFKLVEPELKPWFQTIGHTLFCAVGSFTQPTWKSADFMTSLILKWSKNLRYVTEYGSGIGQYTVPLLMNKSYVTVFENNPLALAALTLNTEKYKQNLQLNPSNEHLDHKDQPAADVYLVNPPRSGLGDFANRILNSDVSRVIYISCSIESLSRDLMILKEKYQVTDLKLVDQFPNSKHFETCILLEKITATH